MEQLKDFIFVLCLRESFKSIRVYEMTVPFDLLMLIPLEEVSIPSNLVSCVASECLYVADAKSACIWKITLRDHQITNWISNLNNVLGVEVVTNGQVVILQSDETSGNKYVNIYGLDAAFIRKIDLPNDLNLLKAIFNLDGQYKAYTRSHGNGNHSMVVSVIVTNREVISHANATDNQQKSASVGLLGMNMTISQFNITDNSYKYPIYELCRSLEWKIVREFVSYYYLQGECIVSPYNFFYLAWEEQALLVIWTQLLGIA